MPCLKNGRPWRSVLSWGVCFRMCHLLYSQMLKVKKHPKLWGPSCCVCVLLTACPGCGQHGFCQRCQRACWRAGTALSDSHPSPDSKAGKWEAWEQSQCSDHSFRGEEDATEENQNEFSLGLPNTLYADSSDLEKFIHRCEFFNSLAANFFLKNSHSNVGKDFWY